MTFIERLSFLITEKAKSKSDFASLIGLSQVTFNNYMLGKRKPSFELVESILRFMPDISAEWLLRGEGEMLKSKSNNMVIDVSGDHVEGQSILNKGDNNIIGGSDTKELQQTIKKLQKVIADQQKSINKLVEKL